MARSFNSSGVKALSPFAEVFEEGYLAFLGLLVAFVFQYSQAWADEFDLQLFHLFFYFGELLEFARDTFDMFFQVTGSMPFLLDLGQPLIVFPFKLFEAFTKIFRLSLLFVERSFKSPYDNRGVG